MSTPIINYSYSQRFNRNYLPVKLMYGFNLLELLITIGVLAILASIAAPNFNETVLGSKLTGYANNLVACSYLARSEAIKRHAVVKLCASSNGSSCAVSGGWEQGWIILSGSTVIKYQQGVGSNIEVINADASFKEAQTNYYAALYDALIASVDLEKSYGKILSNQ